MYVHADVAKFFKFESYDSNVKIAPININRFVGLVDESDEIKRLVKNFDGIVEDLLSLDKSEYTDKINVYKPSAESYSTN